MSNHVRTLGLVFLLYHAIALIIGVLIFFLLSGIGILSGDVQAAGILGIIGTFVAAIMAVLAAPGLIAGYGLLVRRNWARILALVLGCLLHQFNQQIRPLGHPVAVQVRRQVSESSP